MFITDLAFVNNSCYTMGSWPLGVRGTPDPMCKLPASGAVSTAETGRDVIASFLGLTSHSSLLGLIGSLTLY
jgi:hypothetical protein